MKRLNEVLKDLAEQHLTEHGVEKKEIEERRKAIRKQIESRNEHQFTRRGS